MQKRGQILSNTKIDKLTNKLKALKEQEQELLTTKKNLVKLSQLSKVKEQRKIDNRLKILFGAVFLSNCTENDFKRFFELFAVKDKGYIKKHLESSKINNKIKLLLNKPSGKDFFR